MKINDLLSGHTATENYYKVFGSYVCTDGVKALAEKGECFWFITEVVMRTINLHYKNPDNDFLVFTLRRVADTQFKITVSDGNVEIDSNMIPFSDFKYDEAVIWVEQNVMLLPSEH